MSGLELLDNGAVLEVIRDNALLLDPNETSTRILEAVVVLEHRASWQAIENRRD